MIDGIVDLDREWHCVEPSEEDGVTPEYSKVTEYQILRIYWEYWSSRMIAMDRTPHPYHCVMDWVVVNWAEKIR